MLFFIFLRSECWTFYQFFFFLIDLYAFIIGSYIIWTAVAGVRYSIEHIRTKRVAVLLGQIWKWCAIVIKSSVLLSIWVRIIWFFISRNQCSISGLYINYWHIVIVPDFYHSCIDWAALWAFGDRADARACWWKPSIPALSGLGIRTYFSQDMD